MFNSHLICASFAPIIWRWLYESLIFLVLFSLFRLTHIFAAHSIDGANPISFRNCDLYEFCSETMRRRTRRGRMISLGLMFIIYSAINVYSAAVNEAPLDADAKANDLDGVMAETSSADDAISAILSTKSSATISSDADDVKSTTESTTTTTTTKNPATEDRRGKYRPKRNCTPPAIDQFPPTLLPPAFREHGGLIIHILIAIFTFLGLAIVCDDYFVASLDRLCEGEFLIHLLVVQLLFNSLLRRFNSRATFESGCSRSHIHGGWQFCTRTGNGHYWRFLCERRHWRQWSDRFSRV